MPRMKLLEQSGGKLVRVGKRVFKGGGGGGGKCDMRFNNIMLITITGSPDEWSSLFTISAFPVYISGQEFLENLKCIYQPFSL